jgi:hypothetical protein
MSFATRKSLPYTAELNFSAAPQYSAVYYTLRSFMSHTHKHTKKPSVSHKIIEKNLLRLSKLASVSAGNCSLPSSPSLAAAFQLKSRTCTPLPLPKTYTHTHTHKADGVKAVEFLKLHKGNSQHTLLMNSSK